VGQLASTVDSPPACMHLCNLRPACTHPAPQSHRPRPATNKQGHHTGPLPPARSHAASCTATQGHTHTHKHVLLSSMCVVPCHNTDLCTCLGGLSPDVPCLAQPLDSTSCQKHLRDENGGKPQVVLTCPAACSARGSQPETACAVSSATRQKTNVALHVSDHTACSPLFATGGGAHGHWEAHRKNPGAPLALVPPQGMPHIATRKTATPAPFDSRVGLPAQHPGQPNTVVRHCKAVPSATAVHLQQSKSACEHNR
jgi:hypothetical protein